MSGVPHPTVPGWSGVSASAVGPEPPFVIWTATDAGAPTAIAHAREVMMEGAELLQDYNYLHYRFGEGADAIAARHYLGSAQVAILLPAIPSTPDRAAAAVPAPVLAWLQQRYAAVTVLTASGYATLWADPTA